ncbi:hypothetical protein G7Y79_00024g054820 [Physcia stellaris]|nr:hypothetical protein G7Y79_00024g054820 [Physcia stellaris]
MTKKTSSRPVAFRPLPQLPAPLAAHAEIPQLYARVNAIDDEIQAAQSRKQKLKIIIRTSAVHLTSLKQAKRIAMEQEVLDGTNTSLWTKALVVVAARAQQVMDRENVKEHFSHYQKPRILHALVATTQLYSVKLRRRADALGIVAGDMEDIHFALEHWRLIRMEIGDEPHEEVLKEKECNDIIRWLDSALAVAEADATSGEGH